MNQTGKWAVAEGHCIEYFTKNVSCRSFNSKPAKAKARYQGEASLIIAFKTGQGTTDWADAF